MKTFKLIQGEIHASKWWDNYAYAVGVVIIVFLAHRKIEMDGLGDYVAYPYSCSIDSYLQSGDFSTTNEEIGDSNNNEESV